MIETNKEFGRTKESIGKNKNSGLYAGSRFPGFKYSRT